MPGPETANGSWEPLPNGVTWAHAPWFTFRLSRTEMLRFLGPPQLPDCDSGGTGPVDIWALRFPCGLEATLALFAISAVGPVGADERGPVEARSSDLDLEHLRVHLPFPMEQISYWSPHPGRSPPRDWWLVREDDNGNVVDMASFATVCEAGAAARVFEARGHKQTYTVTHRPSAPV